MPGKRILVIYFSQTGQLKHILDSILRPLLKSGCSVDFAEIQPEPAFPFPWSSDQFFDAFPESFMGIPCALKPLQIKNSSDYDLILLGYSPWYLSPSIPVSSFLQSPQAKELLKNKRVITIIGCRNMWLMSQEKIKKYLASAGAILSGNIVLRDTAPNLTSVLTIIRWLIKGTQEATRFLPRAGVSQNEVDHAEIYGDCIIDALEGNDYNDLQQQLNAKGALHVFPNMILFERNGSKIFNMWASLILKKGPYGDPRRKFRHRMFKYYLLAVLFLISPVGSLVYIFVKPFIAAKVKKDVHYFSQNSLEVSN